MTPFSLVVTNVPKERAAFTIYSEDVWCMLLRNTWNYKTDYKAVHSIIP
jgi:hypothetical protein